MEHRLITGGWQYLPFARNRIQALRAAGLTHATDRKVFPDATVTVRIVDDVDYIEISGGLCLLPMESGVVDIGIYASGEDPYRFAAAILHENQGQALYNASFTPDGAWRLNPSKKSAGQISGLLGKSSYFKGKVPYDAQPARSFAPRKIKDGDAFVNDPADQNLVDKKIAAMRCPASMFTGRTRLYAQAMYGQFLYPPDNLRGDGSIVGASDIPLVCPVFLDTSPPSLSLQAYKPKGDEAAYPNVQLNTSCGVHLDAEGKHWLFAVETDHVYVYPLIGSACAEGLRKYLKGPVASDPISDEDRERLEAYVLSSCRPYVKQRVKIDLNVALVTYSMGYGWHWNWSGTQCDMVVNTPFSQGGANTAMRSTHYRITMTRAGALWSFVNSTVEGPVDWTLYRAIWVITEPSWLNFSPGTIAPSYTLLKTTYRNTSAFNCDAPFYCFYARDDLKVCRAGMAEGEGTPPASRWTQGFRSNDDFENPGDIRYATVGLNSGYTESDSGYSDHWLAHFSCGDVVLSDLVYNKVRSGSRIEIVDKQAQAGDPELNWGSTLGIWSIEVGSPPYNVLTYYGFFTFPGSRAVRYRLQTYGWTDTVQSRAAIVIPFYDAEAVYLQAEKKNVRSKTAGMSELQSGGRFMFHQQPKFEDGSFGPVVTTYRSSDISGNNTIEPFAPFSPPDEVTTESSEQKLVHRAGAINAEYGAALDAFFGEDDRVAATFKTLTGTSAVMPVVIGNCEPQGTDFSTGNVALVGAI